jgi:hypothetical protein
VGVVVLYIKKNLVFILNFYSAFPSRVFYLDLSLALALALCHGPRSRRRNCLLLRTQNYCLIAFSVNSSVLHADFAMNEPINYCGNITYQPYERQVQTPPFGTVTNLAHNLQYPFGILIGNDQKISARHPMFVRTGGRLNRVAHNGIMSA